MDLLAKARSKVHSFRDKLLQNETALSRARQDLTATRQQLSLAKRSHDLELTQAATDYEGKLMGLLRHSEAARSLLAEGTDDNTSEYCSIEQRGEGEAESNEHAESLKALVLFSNERVHLMKSEIDRLTKVAEASEASSIQEEIKRNDMLNEIVGLTAQVKFVEEERQIFKEIAEELRATVQSLTAERDKEREKGLSGSVVASASSPRHSSDKILTQVLSREHRLKLNVTLLCSNTLLIFL